MSNEKRTSMNPLLKDAIENLTLPAAYASGYVRRAQALLANGPVLEDLTKIQTELRDLEVRWSQIWEVLHARVTSDDAIKHGTNYASELSNYAYRREQSHGKRTPAQILDPAFLASVEQDLPEGKTREVVTALRQTMEAAHAEAANLQNVIARLEWVRSNPEGSHEGLAVALGAYRPAETFISTEEIPEEALPEIASGVMFDTGSKRLNSLVGSVFNGAPTEEDDFHA